MKKGIIVVLILILVYLLLRGGCSYNKMVRLDEEVEQVWGNVQGAYQRRLDLVQSIVGSVKGSANFEQSTLEGVINARANASKVTIDASRMNAEQMQQFQAAQGELTSALSRLMVVYEKYPDLKTTTQFQDFMAELSGTENRIAQERRNYNERVKEYNTYVRKFPQLIFARLFGFDRRAPFASDSGAEKGVVPDFGDFGNNKGQAQPASQPVQPTAATPAQPAEAAPATTPQPVEQPAAEPQPEAASAEAA